VIQILVATGASRFQAEFEEFALERRMQLSPTAAYEASAA
jgi:hypothetical protein